MASTLVNKSFEFRHVKYVCPECKEFKSLKTPTSSIKKNGLATISISKGPICQHSFLAEIDRDFIQRSSYIPDFTLELPIKDSTPSKKIKLNNLIPKLNSTNFKKSLIKKAHEIINSIVKLGFTVAIRITKRNQGIKHLLN